MSIFVLIPEIQVSGIFYELRVGIIFCFANFLLAPIKCVGSTHGLILTDLENQPYGADAGLEQRFPNTLSIHQRPDSYDLRYRKRSRTVSSVSSVDEDCDEDDRDSTGLYVQSPASFSSQGSNWQNDVDSGKAPWNYDRIWSVLAELQMMVQLQVIPAIDLKVQ